ncbi:MAG: MBL fold metallo-hydrolase [Phycisphaerales bacterium]|nr:MBL fold metallo-hydrolase [Phycisphaerales bacterium]
MHPKLTLKTFALGPWQTNCYVIESTQSTMKDCWIIDAGYDPQPMLQFIQASGLSPVKVILTHAHLDHIAGLHEVRRLWPKVPILIHEMERDFLAEPELNLSAMMDEPVVAPPADELLKHGQNLELYGQIFEIRHTPGHSPGGITLYQPLLKTALVGDTLFARSIGRYDFPTSDGPTLMQSIRDQLLTLPDDTAVLPGHGPATTIGNERKYNPYLRE